MAKKIIKAQMKQRQDTKANWAAANPVLLDGELGFVSDDVNLYKIGDGVTAWNALPFRGFDGTLAQELGTSSNAAISQKAVTEKLTELSAIIKPITSNLHFDKSEVQTVCNIAIPKGKTFTIVVNSDAEWGQLGIFGGEAWTGRIFIEDYVKKGVIYTCTATEDINVIKAFLISAPSYDIDVEVTIDLGALTEQVFRNAQNIKRLNEKIENGLTSEDIADGSITLNKTTFYTTGKNLLDNSHYQLGVLLNGVVYDATEDLRMYITSDYIPVKEGQPYTLSTDGQKRWMERSEVYDKDKKYIMSVADLGDSPIIPTGAYYLRFSIYEDVGSSAWQTAQLEKGTIVTAYEPFRYYISEDVIPSISKETALPYLSNSALSLSIGETLEVIAPNSKNYHTIGASVFFEHMGKIRISHGTDIYSFGVVEIDGNNVYEYANGNLDNPVKTTPHNLNLQKFLRVAIRIEDDVNSARLLMTTFNGEEEYEIEWRGCQYPVILTAISGTYINASILIGGAAFKKNVWIFSDSYADFWMPELYKKGVKEFYADAYSGRKSIQAYDSLINALKIGKPKMLVWAMGMNDGDANEINQDYKGAFDLVKALCQKNGIAFLPCTIPNCPAINHIHKNAYIRDNADCFIDMAKALGADVEGSTWYEGMLSSDNVHPGVQGVVVIVNTFIEHIF